MGKRILVNGVVVGEWIGDTFVHTTQDKHRRRTYAWQDGGLRVTVGGVTEVIVAPQAAVAA